MKKILIACRAYYPDVAGGGEISTRLLAEQLSGIGYNVEVLAISDKDEVEVINNIKINRVKYKNVYWSFKNKHVGLLKKVAWHSIDANNFFIKQNLVKKINEINPDILITSTIEDISTAIWKLAKRNGIRVIHILRSYSLICLNANMFKIDNCNKICNTCKPFSILKKKNSEYVDDVIGISKFVLDKHLSYNYFGNATPHVIYNMCLDEVLSQRKYDGFKNKSIRVGYLGRIHKTKGIELILEALTKLDDKYKNKVELRIAGDGDDNYIEELKLSARKYNITCFFEGLIPANDLLDKIDLLVVPSIWNEPFGRVVVESLGRRVPVAAKRVGGIPELLTGNEGFLFNSSEELKCIITDVLNKNKVFNFNLTPFENEIILRNWQKVIG